MRRALSLSANPLLAVVAEAGEYGDELGCWLRLSGLLLLAAATWRLLLAIRVEKRPVERTVAPLTSAGLTVASTELSSCKVASLSST